MNTRQSVYASDFDKYSAYYADLKDNLLTFNKLFAGICGTKLSLFNVFDSHNQYTITHEGNWSIPQWPRQKCICNYALEDGKYLEIKDIQKTKKFDKIEEPEGIKVLFYAGIPLKNKSGEFYATLCAMSDSAENISNAARKQLKYLGKQLETLLYYYDKNQFFNKREKLIQRSELFNKEIHHRIKNNLADISGMIQMYKSTTKNEEVRSILMKTESRIVAAIKLHELLYESESSDQINIKVYLEKLFSKVYELSATEHSEIEIESEIDDIILDFNQCLPLGLIVCELLTNAFHHAFPNTINGRIQVKMKKVSPNIVQLEISDNGIGQSHSKRRDSSFGLKLIKLLAQQLRATYRFTEEGGSIFKMRFNVIEPDSGRKKTSKILKTLEV